MFSWFNSENQVDAALIWVGIIGAAIEVIVAIIAVINVHKEIEESRKKILERYIEIFTCIAAFLFLAEAILGCRSSMLLGKQLEEMRTNNLVLQKELQPRNITLKQETNFIALCSSLPKMPIRVIIGVKDNETESFAEQVRQLLDAAGFGCTNGGYIRDDTLFSIRPIGVSDESQIFISEFRTNAPLKIYTNEAGEVHFVYDVNPFNFKQIDDVEYVGGVFSQLGIPISHNGKVLTNYLNPGEGAFIIPEKLH
ncbi:MAG TPA: hypothetical protein VGI03_08830 [Verrucomicrobiae bacterium]|jgi:hypothetical protein